MVRMPPRCINFDFSANARSAVKEIVSPKARRIRVRFIAVGAVLWVFILMARLVSLQITDVEKWSEWAVKQHVTEIELASERGPIYDRGGRLMAVSVPAGSLYVRPRQVEDKSLTAHVLAAHLDVPESTLRERLEQPQPFVWVKRQIPRPVVDEIMNQKLPGVGYVLESRRYYPYNTAASTLIGKVGLDGTGLSGIEALYEKHLQKGALSTRVVRDALGNVIQSSTEFPEGLQPPKGEALNLTIDAGLQAIVDEELEAGRKNANAKGAMALLMNAETGEILAMSQAPAFNFNTDKVTSKQALRNMIVESVFEPGSILKPIVAAAAIEENVVRVNDMFDCEHGRYKVGRHTIKDVHPYGILSFHDIVVRSSNIGMTKVGFRLGKDRLFEHLAEFGFGQPSNLGLPGDTRGILRPVSRWATVDVATHSFGQGVAVTPLQVVRAVSAIANGGLLPHLSIIKRDESPRPKRILSPMTAQRVQEMMYGVVEDEHGTGSKAMITGVRVGGKTGTAQEARAGGKGYQPGAYVASFVGFVDATPLGVPQILTMIVAIDEPHTKTIYGGSLAAPVFQRSMQRVLHALMTEYELKRKGSHGEEVPPCDSSDLLRVMS